MDPTTAPKRSVYSSVLRIGLPVAGTQFAFMLLGVVDTALLGRVSPLALGASAVANMWTWAFLSLSLGLVLGAEPFVSQAFGRRDRDAVGLGMQRALILAGLGSLPTMLASALTEPGLRWMGQSPELAAAAGHYNLLRLPSIPAFLVFASLRLFLQARSHTTPALWIAILANLLNLGGGLWLTFGGGPVPALGLTGAAIAASLTSAFMPIALYAWIRILELDKEYRRPWDGQSWAPAGLTPVLRIGVPMAIQTGVEGWGFVIAMLMAGWVSVESLGSHQIAMNLAALAFMLPLGIGIGTSTTVGHCIGASDMPRARQSLRAGFILAVSWGICLAPLIVLGRHLIAAAFTSDPGVQAQVAFLVLFVAAFQPFDAVQAVGAGVLRGTGRPTAGAWMNFLGFAVGLPGAYHFGITRGGGILAIWVAISLRLFVVAGGTGLWAWRLSKEPVEELAVKSSSPLASH